jgi:hypothetical protein
MDLSRIAPIQPEKAINPGMQQVEAHPSFLALFVTPHIPVKNNAQSRNEGYVTKKDAFDDMEVSAHTMDDGDLLNPLNPNAKR